MNGDEQGPNLDEFNPSWMEQGLGFGEETDIQEEVQGWDTDVRSYDQQEQDFTGGGGIGLTVQVAATGDFADGETIVIGVDTITFNSSFFKIHDNGGGEVQVTPKTTTCP